MICDKINVITPLTGSLYGDGGEIWGGGGDECV